MVTDSPCLVMLSNTGVMETAGSCSYHLYFHRYFLFQVSSQSAVHLALLASCLLLRMFLVVPYIEVVLELCYEALVCVTVVQGQVSQLDYHELDH